MVLKDPRSQSNRMQQLGLSATLVSSGRYHSNESEVISLNSAIKLINKKDIKTNSKQLGSGRFETCLMASCSHFKSCKKVYKHVNRSALCKEANILSKFTSQHLFGV